MPIETSLQNFKPITVKSEKAQECAGCGKSHPQGSEVLAKFNRDNSSYANTQITVLCKDTTNECWMNYDWKFWNDRIRTKQNSRKAYLDSKPRFLV